MGLVIYDKSYFLYIINLMKKVLCFGDSNTFGFDPKNGKRFDKNSRWTGILEKFSGSDFQIIEAGCNNRTAFSDNPAGALFTGYKILPEVLKSDIDFVILFIGINDLQFEYGVSFDDIKLGVSKLVKIVQDKVDKAKILLVSSPELTENVLKSPIFSTLFDKTSIEKSKALPKIYSEISKEYGIDFLDLNKIVIPSELDGLHFEPSEHEKIAKEIFNYLKNE